MTISHQFGGNWTEEKINRIKKYLIEYTKIFKKNPKAAYFNIIYVDAFAGTGSRSTKKEINNMEFNIFNDDDVISLQKGSVQIALEIDPSFDQYIFIEKKSEFAKELKNLCNKFPEKRISIICEETNKYLCNWCKQTDWNTNRAVVFLDPYGMEVKWNTIEAIAKTKAIDLWILFPLGSAVNRILTKDHLPESAWAKRLTLFFGTEEWRAAFYKKIVQETLFGSEENIIKKADFNDISKFFVKRLETIFPGVSKNPLPLFNSKNVPIFLLCFAASNPKGFKIAVRISNYILGK